MLPWPPLAAPWPAPRPPRPTPTPNWSPYSHRNSSDSPVPAEHEASSVPLGRVRAGEEAGRLFSTPSRPALRAAACGGRPRPATPRSPPPTGITLHTRWYDGDWRYAAQSPPRLTGSAPFQELRWSWHCSTGRSSTSVCTGTGALASEGPPPSDAFVGFQPSGSDCLDEGLMIQFVLVGVALGEVGDRPVEPVAAAQVGGDGDGVAGAGVGSGQGPAADAGVEAEADRGHRLDLGRALHVV